MIFTESLVFFREIDAAMHALTAKTLAFAELPVLPQSEWTPLAVDGHAMPENLRRLFAVILLWRKELHGKEHYRSGVSFIGRVEVEDRVALAEQLFLFEVCARYPVVEGRTLAVSQGGVLMISGKVPERRTPS